MAPTKWTSSRSFDLPLPPRFLHGSTEGWKNCRPGGCQQETLVPDPAKQSPWGEGVLGRWSGKTVHAEGCVSSPVCSRAHMSINSTVSHMGSRGEILHSSENETFSSSKTRYKAHRQNVEFKKPY